MHAQQKTPMPRLCKQLTVVVATIFTAGITATLIQYRKLPHPFLFYKALRLTMHSLALKSPFFIYPL